MRRIRKSTCPADLLNGCFWQAAKEPTGIFRWLFSVIYSPAAPGILRPARRRGLLPPRWAGAWLRPRGADRRCRPCRTACSRSRASEAYPRPRWPRRRWRRDSSAPPFQDTPSAPFRLKLGADVVELRIRHKHRDDLEDHMLSQSEIITAITDRRTIGENTTK